MSITKKAVRGGIWTALIQYTVFGLTFLGNLWLMRLLSVEDFGIFALAVSAVEIIFILNALGINHACIQLQDEPGVFYTGYIISWLLAGVLIIIGIISVFTIKYFALYSDTIINIIIIMIPCIALQIPASIHLAGIDKDLHFLRSAQVILKLESLNK